MIPYASQIRHREAAARRRDDAAERAAIDDATPRLGSGYTHCGCRDCFETVVSDNVARPDLCDDCATAGCEHVDPYTGASAQCECRVIREDQW